LALLLLLLLRVGLVTALPARPAVLALILLLLLGLLLLVLLLGQSLRCHDAVIVLGVLEIIFRHDAVAGRIGISRKLKIFLVNIRRRPANFHFRT